MNKRNKIFFAIICMLVVTAMLFTGCSVLGEKQYEVSNYQGELKEGETKSNYNKELFYRNDKKAEGADPFVLDNTDIDGYYYMYVTDGFVFCYRSKNLMDWEAMGNALGDWRYDSEENISEELKVNWDCVWAPEVIYDAETELYYMFYSATPKEDDKKGIEEGNAQFQLLVATSQYPFKEFKTVNFKDASSCGKENVRIYDEKAYPQYYAKYAFLDPASYTAFAEAHGGADSERGGYTGAIDPHPYVDENGEKYLFWTDNVGDNRICGIKMENWLKPDWSSAQVLTYCKYYTVADWETAKNGTPVENVSYELETNFINEGATVTKHNNKYYLTLSVNFYTDSSYQIVQAVSDNILGPYRKLTEGEGGVLLSGSEAGSQEISGTGHHSFVSVGEQTYIIYHRHDDYTSAGVYRNPAIDEVKWVTVKDLDGKDLDVMYINGPTCTVQPAIEAYSDYKNIADEANVSGAPDASYLTDGLLSINKFGDETFMQNIRETSISEKTTFTFNFESARKVRAIMVYNSKMEMTYFDNVEKIELVCEENGEEVIRYIENIDFSSEYCMKNDFDNSIYYIIPGACAYTEFDELHVKSVKITIDIPEGQKSVGISEIRILGK